MMRVVPVGSRIVSGDKPATADSHVLPRIGLMRDGTYRRRNRLGGIPTGVNVASAEHDDGEAAADQRIRQRCGAVVSHGSS